MAEQLVLLILFVTVTSSFGGKPIVCYWGSWSTWGYGLENFPTDKCTHPIYFQANVDTESSTITPSDPGRDIENKGYENFVALKGKNPDLKVLISITGRAAQFSPIAASREKRRIFVNSAVKFLNKYNFDGLDVDWEYPTGDENWEDKENFVYLIRELSKALPRGKLLTIALPAGWMGRYHSGYDVRKLAPYLDYFHVMTYDMRQPGGKKADIHTPLRRRPYEWDDDNNIESDMKWFVEQGAPKEKLLVGLAFYGIRYKLLDPSKHNEGDPAVGWPGGYNLDYKDICWKIRNETGWTREHDKEGEAYYAYKGNEWIGYDNPKSLAAKVKFINDNGYGGAFVFSVEKDDFKNQCGMGKNPLIRAVHDNLHKMQNLSDI